LEIVVASGKGGTGKTFLASNLSIFFEKQLGGAVAVDADVEAPDLILALGGERRSISVKEVWESAKASIDYEKCTRCLKCVNVCNFDAMLVENSQPRIIAEFCEGCGACAIVCPAKAITIKQTSTGWISAAESASGVYVIMGDLEVGGRNTGHIVYLAKEEGKKLMRKLGKTHLIVDSAPGIGCPVVSSLSGANLLLIVVEPIPQSLQGARRLLEVAKAFRLETYCVLNKYDLNENFSRKIPAELGLEAIGWIPYDEEVVESYTMMKPLALSDTNSKVREALEDVFNWLSQRVREDDRP